MKGPPTPPEANADGMAAPLPPPPRPVPSPAALRKADGPQELRCTTAPRGNGAGKPGGVVDNDVVDDDEAAKAPLPVTTFFSVAVVDDVPVDEAAAVEDSDSWTR